MMQRLLSLILVTLLLPLSAAAGEKSSAAVLTLKSTGAVPAPVQKRFDQKLRDAVKGHANVVDAAAGEKVAEGRCNESACLKKVQVAKAPSKKTKKTTTPAAPKSPEVGQLPPASAPAPTAAAPSSGPVSVPPLPSKTI